MNACTDVGVTSKKTLLAYCRKCMTYPNSDCCDDNYFLCCSCTEVMAQSKGLVALRWDRAVAQPEFGALVRGRIFDEGQSPIRSNGQSFRVELTHGDRATFNKWLHEVTGIAPCDEDGWYFTEWEEDGGLTITNGHIIEIRFSMFLQQRIDRIARQALWEIETMSMKALESIDPNFLPY